jgi:FAD:protein FMN transferase
MALDFRKVITPIAIATALTVVTAGLAACAGDNEPVRASREALGTVVAVTAYPAGEDTEPSAVDAAIDEAYAAMNEAESELNAHDPDSAIGRVNDTTDPDLAALPDRAEQILDAICVLDVRQHFSPFLLGATEAWAFEEGGRIPDAEELEAALADPRFDFGGAAKGLAIDEAAEELKSSGSVGAALIGSGSTTLVFGRKPDGSPWRIGIEDPRDAEALVASVESEGDLTVSTSGDYQRYFERDGNRYHHILDPTTGMPARGVRSLTVIGAIPGLYSDILSTALFVAGRQAAISYAEEYELGLVLVDDEGRTHIVPGPADANWKIVETKVDE